MGLMPGVVPVVVLALALVRALEPERVQVLEPAAVLGQAQVLELVPDQE